MADTPKDMTKELVSIDPGLSASVRAWLKKHGKSLKFRLSKEREKEFRDCFLLMDTDNSGELDRAELQAAFRLLGLEFDKKELQSLMKEADGDNSGLIDATEFIEIMTETTRKAASDSTSDNTTYLMPFQSLATEYRRKRYMEAVKSERGLRELVEIAERLQEEELKEARLAEMRAKRQLKRHAARQRRSHSSTLNSIRRSDGLDLDFSRSPSLAGSQRDGSEMGRGPTQRNSTLGKSLSRRSSISIKDIDDEGEAPNSGMRRSLGGLSMTSVLTGDSEDSFRRELPKPQAATKVQTAAREEDRRLDQLQRLDRILSKDDPALRNLSHKQIVLLSKASRIGIDPKRLPISSIPPPEPTLGSIATAIGKSKDDDEARYLRPSSAQPWPSRPSSSLSFRGRFGHDPNLSACPNPHLNLTFTRPILTIPRPISSLSHRSIASPTATSPFPRPPSTGQSNERPWSSLSLSSAFLPSPSTSPSAKPLVPHQRPLSSRDKALSYARVVADKATKKRLKSPSPSPQLVPPHLNSQLLQQSSRSPSPMMSTVRSSAQQDLHVESNNIIHSRFPDPKHH